jgi:small-conductance mechanosensitive channel
MHLIMESPVWFLIAKVSGFLGGSGWHRAMLIDNFVSHFFDWWLIGTRDNANWGWSMWDVDNAYVGAGFMGGVIGFILFVAVFVIAYRMIGAAREKAEEANGDPRLIWAIGAALFANTIAFFGIVYFDQSIITWYALLVMISVVTKPEIEGKSTLAERDRNSGSMGDRKIIQGYNIS